MLIFVIGGNYIVRKVLVNHGSSIDIICFSIMQKMRFHNLVSDHIMEI